MTNHQVYIVAWFDDDGKRHEMEFDKREDAECEVSSYKDCGAFVDELTEFEI